MSVTVKNIGAMVKHQTNSDTKSPAATFGEVGTIRVVYQGIEHVFGPNQSKVFSDDGIGKAVAAQNSNLTAYPQDFWR